MNKFITLLLFVFLWANFSLASNAVIYHNELEPVIKGETAHLELNIVSIESDIYEARVFYRAKGDADYQSQIMKDQGYTLYSDLDTREITSGQVEYYFAMQTITGNIITYPQFDPSQNPLSFNLVATSAAVAFQNSEEIILLSPEPNEVIPQDELLIALSIPNTEADIDHAQTRLLIDGINLSSLLEREGMAYILSSNTMRTGSHNAEFKIFGPDGNLLGKLEWTFRITTGSEDAASFRQKTNVFLDNRFQNISENSDNFFRAGAVWNAAYEGWDFRLKVISSTDEGFSGQDKNRFGALIAYNFTQTMRLYLKGGDFSGDYDPLSFWNRRLFGVGFGFNSPWFDLDISSGLTSRAVEGSLNGETINRGIFEESFLAIRPMFHFGRHVSWGLNLVNGKEDPKSIKYGANPKETLVAGTTLKLNFDNNRVRFVGSVQAGVNNNDASQEVDFDSLAEKLDLSGSDKDAAQVFVDILESTGFLTISQGLAPTPRVAMQFDTYLNYFNNYFKISYKNIDQNYRTPGNPYLVNGIRGIFITDNIRLLQNQLFLNLYFKSYEDNLSQKNNVTSNSDIGASLSYFPIQSLPGVTLSYGTQSRKNDFDLQGNEYYKPDSMAFYPEDNSTQRISLSSNYSFNTGDIINTVTLSVSNIERDDKVITQSGGMLFSNNSKFNIISLGLRNKFNVPLTSRIGFSQSTSTLGEGGSTEAESTIMRYYGGADYIVKKFAADMDFKPFVNFALSQLENPDYNRINYTAGFYVNSYDYGNLSLRFDYIDFGDRADWQDMILSTRYDVTF